MSPISVGSSENGLDPVGNASTESILVPAGDASTEAGEHGCRICGDAGNLPPLHSSRPSSMNKVGAAEDDRRWLRRCLEAVGKGFAIGTGIKGGLALFSIAARLRSRGSKGTYARSGNLGFLVCWFCEMLFSRFKVCVVLEGRGRSQMRRRW